MKLSKKQLIEKARGRLNEECLLWLEYNDGYHFKVGIIDFWPTTERWIEKTENGDVKGKGIESLIKHIVKDANKVRSHKLSVQDLVKIATKVKPQNLTSICEAIHKEVYGD